MELGFDYVNSTCVMRINKNLFIPYTEMGFDLQLQGYIVKENILKGIKYGYKAWAPIETLKLYQSHRNLTVKSPSQIIRHLCAADFFRPEANCREKALFCKKSIFGSLEDEIAYISAFKNWVESTTLAIGQSANTCITPPRLSVKFDEKHDVFVCQHQQTTTEFGSETYCKFAIRCLKETHRIVSGYDKELKSCRETSKPYEYGFDNERGWRNKFEFLRTNVSRLLPKRALKKCSNVQHQFELRSWESENGPMLECRRPVRNMIQNIVKVSDCHQFVTICKNMMKCVMNFKPCTDANMGEETHLGFLTRINGSLSNLPDCHHFTVDLVAHHSAIYCEAQSVFKFGNDDFCASFARACQAMVACVAKADMCQFQASGSAFITNRFKNIAFDYPPPVPMTRRTKDLRKMIPKLYQCNKEHGFSYKIHLYFYHIVCSSPNCKNLKTLDKEEQLRAAAKFMDQQFYISYPFRNTFRTTFWFCKRSLLSKASCEDFERVCSQIAKCMTKSELQRDKETGKDSFVADDECYSPLPLDPSMPIPEIASFKGRRAILYEGDAVSYVMPLDEEPLEPFFWPISRANPPQIYRTYMSQIKQQFFFERFVEDCKHAYGFYEGNFLEGYDVDKVEYFVCSFPTGYDKDPSNPSIEKGCNHLKNLCQNMKKCYVRFRKYFNFSRHFKKSMVRIGITCVVLMLFASLMMIFEHLHWLKVKRFFWEKVSEWYLIFLILLGGIILILYPYAEPGYVFNEPWIDVYEYFRLSGLRWAWEITLYFLLVSFHAHVTAYAMRTYFTLSLVTNICKFTR